MVRLDTIGVAVTSVQYRQQLAQQKESCYRSHDETRMPLQDGNVNHRHSHRHSLTGIPPVLKFHSRRRVTTVVSRFLRPTVCHRRAENDKTVSLSR